LYHHYTATLHNTSLHFTLLHFTTLIDTSLPLIYTSLPSHLSHPIYISYCSISPPITKLDTVRIITSPNLFPKIMNPLHCIMLVAQYFTILAVQQRINVYVRKYTLGQVMIRGLCAEYCITLDDVKVIRMVA